MQAETTVECQSEVELFRAHRGELDAAQTEQVLRHVVGCTVCAEIWRQFGLDDQVAASIRSSLRGDVRGADQAPGGREGPEVPENLQVPGFRMSGSFVEGGQARVYRAVHEASGEEVAIKVFHNSALNEGGASRFSRELKSLTRLRHPHVIPIRSEGEVLGHAYLVMPWIEGWPLDEYVRQHRLSIRAKVDMLSKVCSAIMHAHKRGVMHLDLKPTNVRVDSSGEPIILDFGLARFLTAGDADDTAGLGLGVAGTPPYMAPEQVHSREEVDTRADVYALGLLLYEVLAGRRARGGHLQDADLADLRVALEDPVPIRRVAPRIAVDLAAIVAMATAADREVRYQTAERMLEDLQRYLAREPVVAMRGHVLYRAWKLGRKHLAMVLGVTVITLIAGGSLYVLRQAPFELQQSEQAMRNQNEEFARQLYALAGELCGRLAEAYVELGDYEAAKHYYSKMTDYWQAAGQPPRSTGSDPHRRPVLDIGPLPDSVMSGVMAPSLPAWALGPSQTAPPTAQSDAEAATQPAQLPAASAPAE